MAGTDSNHMKFIAVGGIKRTCCTAWHDEARRQSRKQTLGEVDLLFQFDNAAIVEIFNNSKALRWRASQRQHHHHQQQQQQQQRAQAASYTGPMG